jgi:hypothetical protein
LKKWCALEPGTAISTQNLNHFRLAIFLSFQQMFLEAVSKPHLRPNGPADGGIVPLFEILTYWHVRSVFK